MKDDKTYLVVCRDAPGSQEKRREHLAAHLAYVETILDRIQAAGPLVDDGDGAYRASCFIYRAASKAAALQLLFNDPYYRAGIYRDHSIEEFRAVAGRWVGGKAW